MNSLILGSLCVYLFFIFTSRFHAATLRWNNRLLWMVVLANLVTLGVLVSQLDNEPTRFLLVIAAFSVSLLFSIWTAGEGTTLSQSSESSQRGSEFVGLQTVLLALPILNSRVELIALSWLGSSWMWLFWDSHRRRKSEAASKLGFKWNLLAVAISDVLFFIGISLFYISGDNVSGIWNFPAVPTPTLSASATLLWSACLCRISLAPLTSLFEDDKISSDERDLPFAFMQTVGFAFPAVQLLIDPNTGIRSDFFEALHASYDAAVQALAVATALLSLALVFASKRTRSALAALCLNGWLLWALSLTSLQTDWILVGAFQTFLSLALAWALCTHIESTESVSSWIRGTSLAFVILVVGAWTFVVPSSSLIFQLNRFLSEGAIVYWPEKATFYVVTLSLSIIAGRLIGGALLWGESGRTLSSRSFIVESAMLIACLFFASMDITIVATLSFERLDLASVAWLIGPAVLFTGIGALSAKIWAPPLLTRFSFRRKFEPTHRSQYDGNWKRIEQFVWCSPALLLHSSSRALASASQSVVWFAVLLAGAALLFTKVAM